MKSIITHLSAWGMFFILSLTATLNAVADTASSEQAVASLLDRIGGAGTAERFAVSIDASLKSGTNDVFVIGSKEGKPSIKGSSTLAVTTGINWYLNHYAHVNLAWNNLTTDLSAVTLPTPTSEEKHTCSVPYRYYLNYCTFSYSMSTWTWERWQQEIDWMALHGINMPLQIIGLDVVWYNLLTKDLGYSATEAGNFIAGPCFQAWWGMNNLQGWGGPNPEWWYKRQATLCQNILERQRELGMDPVLPGYAGMVPSDIASKGYSANNQGNWCYFVRPYILDPNSDAFSAISELYYKRLEETMGTSKYYSMDPFHEGANTTGIDVASAYKKIAQAMLKANSNAKWVIQYWQWSSEQYNVLSQVDKGKLIILDLFSDAHTHFGEYNGHEAVYCMLPNFGGRTGLFGRLTKVMKEFYSQKSSYSNIKGVGATPEAIEQVPVLYDALFELPWRSTAPNAQTWLADYTVSRYGTSNTNAVNAWEKLRLSALNCETSLQGPHEAVLCARPALTVNSVSSWGGTDIFYDAQEVTKAAFSLLNAKSELSGENYSYDLTDVTRQALSDYGYYLLAAIRSAHTTGDKTAYATRRDAYLQLMLDLDQLLCTNKNFMLGRWTNMARNIADEATGTTEADRQWLELDNARTLITTWGERANSESGGLRDYSYREWGGIMKDFYYDRWKTYFDNLDAGKSQPDWFDHDWTWAHNATLSYSATPTGNTAEVATTLLAKYFLPINVSANDTYFVSRYFATDKQNEVTLSALRGTTFELPITETPEGITLTLSADFNHDGSYSETETTTTKLSIPSNAQLGQTKAVLTLSDGTQFTFTLIIRDEVTSARTISVNTSDASQGTVSISGTSSKSITTTEDVTITAKAKSGYDFYNWTDAEGNVISTDNPYTYVGAADITLTANFLVNKWGSPTEDASELSTIDSYGQYVTSLGVVQNEQAEQTIYTATECPAQLFQTTSVAQAAKGSQITLHWTSGGGLNYCNLSAYIDLDADGEFTGTDELIAAVGTKESSGNSQLNDYSLKVLLPYDMPEGITHIRLRFDGAWMSGYDSSTGAMPAKASTMRMVYEIPLNVTAYCATPCTINVKSANTEKGTVDANGQPDGYEYAAGEEVVLRAYPATGYAVKNWTDKYGRTIPTSWCDGNFLRFRAPESGTYTANFVRELASPLTIGDWKFDFTEENGDITLTKVVSGSGELTIPATYEDDYTIKTFAPALLQGQEGLTLLSIPATLTDLGNATSAPFRGCTNLAELKVASGNKSYRATSNVLLSADGSQLLAYPEGRLSHRYTMGSTIKSIAANAFTRAPQLERITTSSATPPSLSNEALGETTFFVQTSAKNAAAWRTALEHPIVLNASASSTLSASDAAVLADGDAVDLNATDTQCAKAPDLSADVQIWLSRTYAGKQLYPIYFPFVPTSVSVEGLKLEDTPLSALTLFEYNNGSFVHTTDLKPGAYLVLFPDTWSTGKTTFHFAAKGTAALATEGFTGNGSTDAVQVTGNAYSYDAATNTFNLQSGTTIEVQPYAAILMHSEGMPNTIAGPDFTSGIHDITINSSATERLYTPAGIVARPNHHGVVISQSGQKRMQK